MSGVISTRLSERFRFVLAMGNQEQYGQIAVALFLSNYKILDHLLRTAKKQENCFEAKF